MPIRDEVRLPLQQLLGDGEHLTQGISTNRYATSALGRSATQANFCPRRPSAKSQPTAMPPPTEG